MFNVWSTFIFVRTNIKLKLECNSLTWILCNFHRIVNSSRMFSMNNKLGFHNLLKFFKDYLLEPRTTIHKKSNHKKTALLTHILFKHFAASE